MTTLDASPRAAAPALVVAPEPRSSRVIARARVWDRWWIATLVLPMMVVSDWKMRHRNAAQTLGGSPDAQVLVEIAIYGLVAIALVLSRRSRAPRLARTPALLFCMWWFGAALFCSAFYAVYPTLGIARGIQMLIACAVAQTIATRARLDDLHRFAHAFIVLITAAVPLGFVAQYYVSRNALGRFHWMYVHPVPAGIFLMIACVASAAYLRNPALRNVLGIWPRWAYGATAAVTGLGLILTKTRGSIGAAAIALLLVVAMQTRAKTKLDIVAFMVTAAAAVVMIAGSLILAYLERGEGTAKLTTLNERTNLWTLAWEKFQQQPLFGYGLGASRGLFLALVGLGGGHNAFVNVMVDAGLFGLVPFFALLVVLGALMLRLQRANPGRRDVLLLAPIFVGLLANSMTAEFMAVPANTASMWLLIIVAWVAVLQRANRGVAAASRRA